MNTCEKNLKDFYRQYHNLEVNKVINNTLVFKFQPHLITNGKVVGFLMLCLLLYNSFKQPINTYTYFFIILLICAIITFLINFFAKYTIYFQDNKMIIKRLFFEKKIELGNVMEIRVFEIYYHKSDLDTLLDENTYKYQMMVREKGTFEYVKIFTIFRESDIEYAEEFINNFVNENQNS